MVLSVFLPQRRIFVFPTYPLVARRPVGAEFDPNLQFFLFGSEFVSVGFLSFYPVVPSSYLTSTSPVSFLSPFLFFFLRRSSLFQFFSPLPFLCHCYFWFFLPFCSGWSHSRCTLLSTFPKEFLLSFLVFFSLWERRRSEKKIIVDWLVCAQDIEKKVKQEMIWEKVRKRDRKQLLRDQSTWWSFFFFLI